MSRYMLSLLRRGQLEVLSRRTISGDRSKVYLLGTTHRTAGNDAMIARRKMELKKLYPRMSIYNLGEDQPQPMINI
ncbi:hypothetical protein P8452_53695 [Trifolium repens]|nr:hypothetical protein P8452_53695 [Trifolium repens]